MKRRAFLIFFFLFTFVPYAFATPPSLTITSPEEDSLVSQAVIIEAAFSKAPKTRLVEEKGSSLGRETSRKINEIMAKYTQEHLNYHKKLYEEERWRYYWSYLGGYHTKCEGDNILSCKFGLKEADLVLVESRTPTSRYHSSYEREGARQLVSLRVNLLTNQKQLLAQMKKEISSVRKGKFEKKYLFTLTRLESECSHKIKILENVIRSYTKFIERAAKRWDKRRTRATKISRNFKADMRSYDMSLRRTLKNKELLDKEYYSQERDQ